MSIRSEINRLICAGKLFRLEPRNRKDPRRRTVLMSEEIHELAEGPWPEGDMGDRCAFLRNDLEAFVTQEFITVCWEPYEAHDEQIGRLYADEVWDLRCQEPSPGFRVFCRFIEKDILLATNCSPRSVVVPWFNKLPLLAQDSVHWKIAIAECQAIWSILLPKHPPHSGKTAHDYISNAVL